MFNITAIPALQDNYIWAIHDAHHAVVVDPGEAAPVQTFLKKHDLQLDAILCTHRHADHIGGIAELRAVYNVPVYGRLHPANPHVTHDLRDGDRVHLDAFNLDLDVLEVPGHVDDHLAYVGPDLLFCGDVLFGAGCGKNFEGTVAQLYHSLQRLAQLPDTTRVYCAHEYTQDNLRFARACEPGNAALLQRIAATQRQIAADQPTVPSTIAQEKATNPFLRCAAPGVLRTLQQRGMRDTGEIAVFTALREWKNQFY